jgi:hypothetical protein
MNKHIKQFERESNIDVYGLGLDRAKWETAVGKFAELIVKECIEQVRGEFLPVLEDKEMMKDTHWDGYVQCGVDSVVAIREHFSGVEL